MSYREVTWLTIREPLLHDKKVLMVRTNQVKRSKRAVRHAIDLAVAIENLNQYLLSAVKAYNEVFSRLIEADKCELAGNVREWISLVRDMMTASNKIFVEAQEIIDGHRKVKRMEELEAVI